MSRIRQVKTTFTAGEVAPEIMGRGDLRAYDNGALKLKNLFIHSTGGVSRRSGLRHIDTIPDNGRLIPFEFNTEQTYLLAITDFKIHIYLNDIKISDLVTPWSSDQIKQISWTQSADTLILTHPEVKPKKLVRLSNGNWELQDWVFFIENSISYQPYYKFVDSDVTLTPSSTSGTITLTSSSPVFSIGHEAVKIKFRDIQCEVISYDSPTVVTVNLNNPIPDTTPSIDWQEQAFSEVRGYPITVAFHQDRLVIGGSRDLPNRLWFSKSGNLFNFDLGTGLDDESIEFAILSDQVNAIRGIFSGRHLQVFTSGAEWMVTGDPLTPQTVQLKRQTRVGSVIDRYIPPIDVDGATLFMARNKQEIREFLYTDIEQAYQSTDLALLSRHLIINPIDQDFDQKRRLLFIVREDGKFITLTIYRAEQVAAWTFHETAGNVKSVSVVGENTYLLIDRGGVYSIELFDETLNLDASLTGSSDTDKLTWSGIDHLENKNVTAVADGFIYEDLKVINGSITLPIPASNVEIGLPYSHRIEPLPPSTISTVGGGRKVRLVEAIFRLKDTSSLRLDIGRGMKDIPLRDADSVILGSPPPRISDDIRVRSLGWQSKLSSPLWKIEQDTPLPFTLLSVITEIKVND